MQSTLKMRADAHEQAEKLGLLDAVRTIAKSGSRLQGSQFLADLELFERDANGDAIDKAVPFEAYRCSYGERQGEPDFPYCEVVALRFSKDHPVHQGSKKGESFSLNHHGRPFENPPDSVTGTELLYKHTDLNGGETVCFVPGPWVDKLLDAAKKIPKV